MLIAAAADRASSAASDEPAAAVHQTTIERAFGRIFAMFIALIVVVFWFDSATLAGQRPGSMAANLLLSTLLVWQAVQALRRPPSQQDLYVLATATGLLLLLSRALAVPGSPFLVDDAYLLAVPAAAAWAVWSVRLVVPVPILLVVLTTGVLAHGGDVAVEQAVVALATVACTSWAARFMRAGARRADADADALSRRMAAQDAALAAEEAERRVANAVHDDVLSVLRAVSAADRQVSWSLVVSKAKGAQDALARHGPRGDKGPADLGSALRRAGESAAELDVRYDIDGDIDVPLSAVEALSAAAGEALRNVATHAGVRRAVVTARASRPGRVTVTVSDDGIGFDPARVGPASTGLRSSVQERLADAGGRAEIISAPGQGTSVALTWSPPQLASAPGADPLALVRRMAPSPPLIFTGFMLPIVLAGLVLLCLHWQDMRWPAAAATAFGGMLGLAVLSARYLSQVRMTRQVGVRLAAANIILAAVASLAVAPGTTDAFAYWVAGNSGIVIAAVYFIRGPLFGLIALAVDLAALMAGLLVTGRGIAAGGWVSMLTSPAIGAGLAAAMLAAFRSLSSHTESQLAGYRERLRLQARAEAISRVDNAALENARRVAGPVLSAVVSRPAADPALKTAAVLANAILRDELLAPGFLTTDLADCVQAARMSGAQVTVNIARHGDPALTESARRLLAAALDQGDSLAEATLQVHPPAGGHPALLMLHLRSQGTSEHLSLRQCARDCGALLEELGDNEFLVRLQAA